MHPPAFLRQPYFQYSDVLCSCNTGIYYKSPYFNIQITLIQYTQKSIKIRSQVMGLYLLFSEYGQDNSEKKPTAQDRLSPHVPSI